MERLDAFMARANAAYYATQDPFRDFTTAPEITQVFGELLGLWAATVWDQMGRPAPVILAECGPGRGALMQDAIRAIAQVTPEFHAAHRLHLVETSPRLHAQQAARLPAAIWHDAIDTLPAGPMILLANEFLDALPIRQFVRRGAAWTERWVEHGAFVERAASAPDPLEAVMPGLDPGTHAVQPDEAHGLKHRSLKPGPRAVAGAGGVGSFTGATRGPAMTGEAETHEINEPALAIAKSIAARLKTQGGAALFLDYGPTASAPGDSLQALRDGRPANPLADPGLSDLTAHVDFAALARTAHAAGATPHGPIRQGPFLARLGLFQRTGVLARTQPPARAALLIESAQRLAEPDRMGGLFKALALCDPRLPTPPGFEP